MNNLNNIRINIIRIYVIFKEPKGHWTFPERMILGAWHPIFQCTYISVTVVNLFGWWMYVMALGSALMAVMKSTVSHFYFKYTLNN